MPWVGQNIALHALPAAHYFILFHRIFFIINLKIKTIMKDVALPEAAFFESSATRRRGGCLHLNEEVLPMTEHIA